MTTEETVKADVSEREALTQRLRSFQTNINTALPGTVIEVFEYSVTVRIDILRKFNGEIQLPIEVPDVAVMFPGTSGGRLSWPIDEGDTGLLIFCQRDIDRWLSGSAPTAPATARVHDFSDAVWLPGLAPIGSIGIPDALTLENSVSELVLDGAGTVTIAGPQATAMLDATGSIRIGNGLAGLVISPDGSVELAGAGGTIGVSSTGAVTVGGGESENISQLLLELIQILSTTTVLPHSPGGSAAISSQPALIAMVARFQKLLG